jgi:hypothetical protein
MRKLLFMLILSGFSLGCLGQTLNEVKIKKMMLGTWINLDDSALTVNITKDSIEECTNGSYPEADFYTYKISRHNCNNSVSGSSPTGYYLTKKDRDDGECLCGVIQTVSADQITITFADDSLMLKRIR